MDSFCVRSSRRSGNAADASMADAWAGRVRICQPLEQATRAAIGEARARPRGWNRVVLQQQLHHFAGSLGPQFWRDADEVCGASGQLDAKIASLGRSLGIASNTALPQPSAPGRTRLRLWPVLKTAEFT